MPAGRLVNIPFALGQDEEQAPRELPTGPFRAVENVRQRRGGAFGMRADYLAAGMDEFEGTLTPCDLYNLNGRLFCLGTNANLAVPSPTDVYEYVQQPGGTWKGTTRVGDSLTRIPGVTGMRSIGQTPDGVLQAQTARVAAVNGLVCLVYGFGQATGGSTSYVHIFRANTDSTILFSPVAAANAQVVVAGDSFWVIGVDASNDLVGFRFDTGSDDRLQNSVTLYTGTVSNAIFDASSVEASPIVQFVVFIRDGSTTVVRRYDEAGTQLSTFAGPAVAADALGIHAKASTDEIVVVTRQGAADAEMSTYDLTSATLTLGPTTVFGEAVSGSLIINRDGNVMYIMTEASDSRILRALRGAQTHVGSTRTAYNFRMAGKAALSNVGMAYPVISGDGSNQILFFDILDSTNAYVGAQLDERIANPLLGAVGKGGQVALDATTGLFYWGRIVEGTDGQTLALAAEMAIASTGRRQACQVGNLLFISGGTPLSFDGRQIAEAGFLERPVFEASTPSATGGDLIPGAEYDYVAVFKWVDGQNRQTQSMVSDVQTVTMGASDNGVTHTIFAPHSLRRDPNSGSVPTISLYRTDASLEEEPASVGGSNSIDPPSSTLDGLTLRVIDTTGGLNVVTFTAAATTESAVLSEINAVVAPDVVATSEGGRLVLTTVDEGTSATILVQRTGTANSILGFSTSVDTADSGTTEYIKGTIFSLAASAIVPLADDFGEPVTVVDNTSDEDLLEAAKLYTQGERGALTGVLESEAPPAADFCATVGARVFLGGLANRSEVAISKELFPAEGIAFSSNLSFRSTVDGDVTAVGSLDGVPIAFTSDAVFRFPSELPDDAGAAGELGVPYRIPSESGTENPSSIVETSLGLFYQATDGKLMLLPRGGASPMWIGRKVQDTLADFPTVVGAAMVNEDYCVAFCCVAADGLSSTILVFDLRIQQWYRDTFTSAQVIRSVVDYQGRLAYIDDDTVRLQSASATPSAFIEYHALTGSIEAFGGNGWGRFISVTVAGEFLGEAQLRLRVSYDDGETFTNLKTFTFEAPDFTAGDSITAQWWPRIRKCSAFVLDFQVLTNGTATAGLNLNRYTLEVLGTPVGRYRTSAAQRG